jgi:hypothetical protein
MSKNFASQGKKGASFGAEFLQITPQVGIFSSFLCQSKVGVMSADRALVLAVRI